MRCILIDAGFMRLVFLDFLLSLLPYLAFVFLSWMRFLMSGTAKHCDTFDTTLPLRDPDVHRYLRTTFLPDLAQTCFSDIIFENNSRNNI